jgi:hypothetical protein
LLKETKNLGCQVRQVEQHDCYIRLAPCHAALNLRHPSNEKELRAVLLREPERIRLQGWNSWT